MSYLIFSPTCTIFVYPTFNERNFKVPTHPVNLLSVYLSPKQVVALHSGRLFVVFWYDDDHLQLRLRHYKHGVKGECAGPG